MKIEERSFFLCSSLRDEYRYFDRRLKRERQLRKRNKSFEYGRIAIIIYSLYQWNTSINVRILTFLPMPSSSTYRHISDMSRFFNGRRTFGDKTWIGGKGFRMWWRNATVHVDFISFSCYRIYYNEETYFSFFA